MERTGGKEIDPAVCMRLRHMEEGHEEKMTMPTIRLYIALQQSIGSCEVVTKEKSTAAGVN